MEIWTRSPQEIQRAKNRWFKDGEITRSGRTKRRLAIRAPNNGTETVLQRNGARFLYEHVPLENDKISDRASSFAKTDPSFISGALDNNMCPFSLIECDDSTWFPASPGIVSR